MRPFVTLLSAAVVLGAFASCEKYEAQPVEPFHSGFVWGPAHGPSLETLQYDASVDTDTVYDANNFCDKCHLGAASQQVTDGVVNLDGDLVVFSDPTLGWATKLSPLCQDCHPLRVGAVNEPPDCNAQAGLEYCRYEAQTAHNNVNPVNGCTGAACHQIDPPTSWAVGGGPGGAGHDDPPLSNVFPLDGGHATADCADCHADLANAANERGQAAYCGNCHDRAGEGKDATHYPPDRAGWTDERERDCRACHSTVTPTNALVTPNNWAANNDHQFRVPHNTVVDWDTYPAVTANPDTDWKADCAGCHDVGAVTGGATYIAPDDGRFSCGVSCHDLAALEAQYPAFHSNLVNSPAGCNDANCHPSGTIEGVNEPN
ncbi:MAG: cytochrome c3 family protein [Myxococcota bacterium]